MFYAKMSAVLHTKHNSLSYTNFAINDIWEIIAGTVRTAKNYILAKRIGLAYYSRWNRACSTQ